MALGKFLTVDPGEDTGWAIWDGPRLIDSGTTKMWDFGDAVWGAVSSEFFDSLPEDLETLSNQLLGIKLVVVENWTLYPKKLRVGALDWDECRTARLIGSIFQACRVSGWAYEQQPAAIKERAVAAGAEAYFSHPLYENRHANDAIMHGVFRNALDAGAAWTDLSKREFVAPPEHHVV